MPLKNLQLQLQLVSLEPKEALYSKPCVPLVMQVQLTKSLKFTRMFPQVQYYCLAEIVYCQKDIAKP